MLFLNEQSSCSQLLPPFGGVLWQGYQDFIMKENTITNPYFIKRNLSFWEIWNMSFGFLGIQFGWGLQMANMSAIYENLGAKADDIPGLWLAAPLTGLIVQPIIGYLSDTTWTPLGRRKPFFLVGAILASIMLLIMPHSSSLWMAAGLLWMLDASINISMEPFRAFVADMLPAEQQTKGFTMQSVFIGLGAIIASALPWVFTNWLHVSNETLPGSIPTNVRWSFYIGAVAFFSAVFYTIYTTKEYPPADMEGFLADKAIAQQEGLLGRIMRGAKEIINGVFTMPKVMRQLSLVQFLTWPGLFLMWFYFGVGISRTVFGFVDFPEEQTKFYEYLVKNETSTTTMQFPAVEQAMSVKYGSIQNFKAIMKENNQRKSEGGDWGGLCFAFYSLITFIFSFTFLPRMAERYGQKRTHFICLLIGALGLFSVGFISSKYLLLFSMACVGIAWSSILSMPYAMLVRHLSDRQTGLYVGIFNFFIVIPEILATLFFGWVMHHLLGDNRITAVVCGGGLLLLAAFATLQVEDGEKI
jgi:maltose/moltooligosaccharide transporter